MNTRADYTIRQGAYDLRKLRGKGLAAKPGPTRRYHIPPEAARTITALLALHDHIIAPIPAGVRSPRRGRKPAHRTRIDRDYQTLRTGMQDLFHDLGIAPTAAAAAYTTFCRSGKCKLLGRAAAADQRKLRRVPGMPWEV